jgi:ectoine hydroxylase-related dioxygenase (phytanoyl-CoA dioxygenase family)
MSLTKNLQILNKKGYLILENIFSKKSTKLFRSRLEKILIQRLKKKKVVGHNDNQVLYNYFVEDKSLIKLIHIPKVDLILQKILEPNYVMQSTNAQNRIKGKIQKNIKLKKKYKIGSTWHTDSRYLNNKRLDKGFSYLVVIALDSFNKLNGPTKFIQNSFNYRSRPNRKINLRHQELIMKEGSVCIMDTGMWHKGGESTSKSRWSIFSIYTGWFVKPYYNYSRFIKQNNLSKKYKKLLHHYSIPPELNEHRGTVTNSK